MNKLIKEEIENYYNNINVVILGPNEKTWNKQGFSVSLSDTELKYFVAILSNDNKCDYYLHFENYSDSDYTTAQKNILFSKMAECIKPGEIISTRGGVTPGGISALKKFVNYGFEIIDTYSGKKLIWATEDLLDIDKFNEWIAKENHKNDYKIIDETLPITKENTMPVVVILRKK